ncbi:hypothetical protein GCM10009541_54060 [Micromonospora gifhornensis]|uniref:Peptidase C14 caspase domain-containing protein n=1 Tax=Micromonospora gifhornensis TaxID=84594 RepID=A0ABQ4IKE3_9ACTN|nr:caspase family protein [Micromonospora gifhornensis]GIJ18385.1 hypothetical protein Vgi01_50690 [Micromonospora gifhornensis]
MYVEDPASTPGVHALVIGVGGYRHLPGGTGPQIPDPTQFYGLGQLTSAPVSAVAVAEWLRTTADPDLWTVPLASVDLLVSPHPDVTDAVPATTEPTIANIVEAYARWRQRASTHPDNVALFYFCGHGLQFDTQRLLLASDFRANEFSPLTGAFEFESTRNASTQGLPRTQCFFVDSCAGTAPYLMSHRVVVQGLETAAVNTVGGGASSTVTVLASAPGITAEGRRNEVSYFTRALLAAFSGRAASRNVYQDWAVHTTDLGPAIDTLVRDFRGDDNQPTRQDDMRGKAELWRLAGAPPVEFTVACAPTDAHRTAELTYQRLEDADVHRLGSSPSDGAPWTVRSAAGSHRLEATFGRKEYPDTLRLVEVLPPGSPIRLRVLP